MQQDTTWHRLKCDCGGDLFLRLSYLRHKTESGMTDEPAGWMCMACHGKVDTGRLIQLDELQRKQKELRELQREVGQQEAAAPKPGRG